MLLYYLFIYFCFASYCTFALHHNNARSAKQQKLKTIIFFFFLQNKDTILKQINENT